MVVRPVARRSVQQRNKYNLVEHPKRKANFNITYLTIPTLLSLAVGFFRFFIVVVVFVVRTCISDVETSLDDCPRQHHELMMQLSKREREGRTDMRCARLVHTRTVV